MLWADPSYCRSWRTPRRPTPSSGATTSAGIPRREQASPRRPACSTKRKARSTDNPSPSYVTSITDPTELTQVLEEHINAVLGRYGNDLYAFDVINEREC